MRKHRGTARRACGVARSEDTLPRPQRAQCLTERKIAGEGSFDDEIAAAGAHARQHQVGD